MTRTQTTFAPRALGLCAFIVVAIVFATDAAEKNTKHSMMFSGKTKSTCLYGKTRYRPGQRFRPDACTLCKCPKRGSRPRCAVQDCRWEPNCLSYDRSENKCCGKCTEYGCLTANGTVHRLGEVISLTRCERCVCPREGGPPRCFRRQRCPRTECVDAVTADGDCCMHCPNGSNCWLNGHIIKAGRVVDGDDGHMYKCPKGRLPLWLRHHGRQAMCVDCFV